LSDSTGLAPYRPGQGVYARGAAGAAMLLLAAFGSWRLYSKVLLLTDRAFPLLGMNVPYAALWAVAVFLLAAGLVFVFTFAPATGLKWVDSRARGFVDLLVDTEAELAKVSWATSDELVRSTTAVVVFIVLLGAFLFCVDWAVAFAMRKLGVL